MANSDARLVLSRADMSYCAGVANLRWQLARAAGVVNQRHDKNHDDADVDLLGVKAELAVSRAYSLHQIPGATGVDDGNDMFAGNIGIDVKSTFHRDGNLLFKSKKAFRADVSVLVAQGERDNVMIIRGWVGRDRFLEQAELQKVGGSGHALLLSHTKLAPPASLWLYLNNVNQSEAA